MRVRYDALLLLALLALGASEARGQWQKSPDFPNDFFNEVLFVDNNYGWVTRMNGDVSRTTDGGNTWSTSTLPGSAWSSNRDICFLSQTLGFVSGEDGIWKTTNGGSTWTTITPATGFTGASTAMWFIDASNGVAGTGGCIDSTVTFFRTTDGGTTWSSVQYTSTQDVAVGGITYMGGAFYACGGRGKLWRSNDGGANWAMSLTGSNGWQEDIISYGSDLLIASTDGSACGVSSGGTVLRSTNSGSSWTISTFRTLMWGVTRYSSTDGWACGDGGLALKTTDGGNTWTDQSCGLPRAIRVDDICFTDATHGWAVGDGLYRLADQTIEVSPDTIDFGNVRVGTSSADSSVVVRSFFTSATTASVRLGGQDPLQFELSGGSVSIPVGVCSSSPTPVRFKPTSRGPKVALVEVTIPSTTIRRFVVVKGNGVEPEISVLAEPALDTMVCNTTVEDSILIRNVGTAPLLITGVINVDPPGGQLVRISPTLPVSIPPGGFIWMRVRATASAPGSYESQLQIHSDDLLPGHSPLVVRMRYYRRLVVPAFSASVVALPPTTVGEKSAQACIEYRNNGEGTQWIDEVVPAAGDPQIVALAQTFPIAVAPGGTVRLCFEGVPADTGWFARSFRVRGGPCDLDTPLTVRLYGLSPIVRSDTLLALPAITCETAARATTSIVNDGNDTLVLEQPVATGPDAAGVAIIAPTTWPLRIAPRESAELVVDLEPLTVGAPASATLTFATNDRRGGRERWSIRITTTRNSALARPVDRSIDVGAFCAPETRSVSILIEGIGTTPSHVSSARVLDESAAIATIAVGPSGLPLASGERDSLVVVLSPTGIGPFRALIELRSDPCDRIDTVEIIGTVQHVSLASDDVLTIGTVVRGRQTTATVTVRNDGNVAATILAGPTSTPSRITITSPALPATIPAGGSLVLTLDLSTATTGSIAEQLRVVSTADCRDTLTLDLSANVVEPGGISLIVNTREVRFGTLLRCEDSCSAVELDAVGEKPVSILSARIDGGSGSISLGSIAMPVDIAPGSRLAIPVCYAPRVDDENESATLVLTTSDTALAEVRIPLLGSSVEGLSTVSSVSFGIVPDGVMRDTSIVISNPHTARALDILWARVSAPFTVQTALPLNVPPGGSALLVLRAGDIDAYEQAQLVLGTSHPCGDSLVVDLDALSDDRFILAASADTAVARWGERVAVAIAFEDTTNARVSAIDLTVTAAPTLLEPIATNAAPGLAVERVDFDASSGMLQLRVRRLDGSPLTTTEALVSISYEVLRGDRIATPITPVITGLRPGITSVSRAGAFLLADYCDAHARLLTTTGSIALEQNAPNPAKAATVIEFETSFDGHVVLALYDTRGIERVRLVDEWMPAGRRRVAVPLADLEAGAYTYRLTTGLQSLARRMVVTP